MTDSREKPTVQFCHFVDDCGQGCLNQPSWLLQSDTNKIKVCDEHLAWGIKTTGIPARVDQYDEKPLKTLYPKKAK